jgi:sec-independent protein translocase protein TatA
MLLFGTGKVSTLMGDFAKGIKEFKKNMADNSDASMEASTTEKPSGSIAPPAAQASTTNPQSTQAHQG